MQPFNKPALTTDNLLTLLKQRGLIINNYEKAAHYINTIGYYRLSAYFIPFYKYKDRFHNNTVFDDILNLYIFDRKLRILALDPLERIEIALRTTISNHMSIKYDPFWFLDKNIYKNIDYYNYFIKESKIYAGINRKNKSIPCKHYFTKYGDRELPPSWILIEELPMGCWLKLYGGLKNKQDKRAIAEKFNFKWIDLESWIKHMVVLRNICAHHRRLWNISIPVIPKNLKKYINDDAGNLAGVYQSFVIIMAFIKRFTHNPSWHTNLPPLFESCPLDPHIHMHFPKNWEALPFWN